MIGVILGLICLLTSIIFLLSGIFLSKVSKVPTYSLFIIGVVSTAVGFHQLRNERTKDNVALCTAPGLARQSKLINNECYLKVGDNLWMGNDPLERRFLTDKEIKEK